VLVKTREPDRIWNVSQDLMVVTDIKGVWQSVNRLCRTLGWTEHEVLNRTSNGWSIRDDRDRTVAEIEACAWTAVDPLREPFRTGTARTAAVLTAGPDDGRIYGWRRLTAEMAAANG